MFFVFIVCVNVYAALGSLFLLSCGHLYVHGVFVSVDLIFFLNRAGSFSSRHCSLKIEA